MPELDILKHENTRLIEQNKLFELYLFSGSMKKDLKMVFKSKELAIFVCLSGKLISSTQTLSYHLNEKHISFALKHDCKKIIPKDVFTEFMIITFSLKSLKKLIKNAGEDVNLTLSHFTSCQCTVHNSNSEILSLSRKLLKESVEKYWGYRINLNFIFQELLIAFVRLFASDKINKTEQTAVQAKQILQANVEKELNLEKLADECGVSKSHLCRLFKKSTGQTISQFFNSLKVEYACKLLKETEDSIEQIAFNSGFNNPSYFFRVFKKQTGYLPLEWRKNHSLVNELMRK